MLLGNNTNAKEQFDIVFHTFRGVDGLMEFIRSFDKEVIVYFDPDVDGCIAGLLVCRFISKLGIKFTWYINSNREHNWSLPLSKISGKDIIAVDFKIESWQISEIVDSGCNLLSIDHHLNGNTFIDIESDYGTRGILINNQYPFEPEDGRYLSGAGVVFEVLRLLLPEFDTEENRALVGITLLSDVRDIENPSARGYLHTLYTHKYKGYIKYLIDHTMGEKDYGFGVPRMDRNYVDYKFSPAINACLRFNQQDAVVEFFLGSNLLDLSYRTMQKELVVQIQKFAKIIEFPNLRVVYFEEWNLLKYKSILSSFVGLTASRYLDGKSSVICYMIALDENNKKYIKRASFRGNINGLPYQTNLSEYINGAGHESAFGIKGLIPSKKLIQKCSDICKHVEKDSGYSKKIINVPNLSVFVATKGKDIGTENMYKLSQNMCYLRYTGSNIQRKRSGANYAEYSVDGETVMNFDKSVTFENGLILPIMERKVLGLYLQSEDNISDLG